MKMTEILIKNRGRKRYIHPVMNAYGIRVSSLECLNSNQNCTSHCLAIYYPLRCFYNSFIQ